MPPAAGSTLTQILADIGSRIAANPATFTERDVQAAFFDAGFFATLGYDASEIHSYQERTRNASRRPAVIVSHPSTSVKAVFEFTAPDVSLQSQTAYIRDAVEQLDAETGVITNGVELWLFDGTAGSAQIVCKLSLASLAEQEAQTDAVVQLANALETNRWSLADPNHLDAAVEHTAINPISLDSAVAQTYFFRTFRFGHDGPFGELIEAGMALLSAYQEANVDAVTDEFVFWRRSAARLPDPEAVPPTWEPYVAPDGTVEEDRLAEFMFVLESGFALLSKLFVAKAADDHQLLGDQPLRDRLDELTTTETVEPTSYIGVVDELFAALDAELVESGLDAALFEWWANGFEAADSGFADAYASFGAAVGKLLLSVLQFEFSRTPHVDLLGELYQRYFAAETRKALGEFYTPAGVVELMLDRTEYTADAGIHRQRLTDPACGSGAFLSAALKRYLAAVRHHAAGEPDWQTALDRLCVGPRIVGLDTNPFAVFLAQLSMLLAVLDPYAQANAADETFTLRRLPVFRTNSLRKESQQPGAHLAGDGQQSLFGVDGPANTAAVPVVLPIADASSPADGDRQEDTPLVETTLTLPRFDAVTAVSSAGVETYDEYFGLLLGLLDVVKAHRRAGVESYTPACCCIEAALGRYLDVPPNGLESVLAPSVNGLLDTLDDLDVHASQERLLSVIEDAALSVVVKNYLSYDYVIANPPYVSANSIDAELKGELEAAYPETTTGKYDLYCPFYQFGVERLRPGGTLGYITPNQFMVTEYGRGVRSYLTAETTIKALYDFRDSGVFADATNYPLVVVAEKQVETPADHTIHCARLKRLDGDSEAELDSSLDERARRRLVETVETETYSDRFLDVFPFAQSELRAAYWAPMPADEWAVFRQIEAHADALLDGFLDLHAGTQTGANDVYLVTPVDADRIGADETGRTVEVIPKGKREPVRLECDLLRPWLRGSDVERWRPSWSGEHVLFPYKEASGRGGPKSIPLDPHELQALEHTWAYLTANEDQLKQRDNGAMADEPHWYAFSAPKSHVALSRPKVIAAETASETRFARDDDGSWLFKSAYGAPIPPEFRDRQASLAAYLNSPVFDFYLKHVSSLKSGGHYKYTTNYVGRVPVRTEIPDAIQTRIQSAVTEILDAIDLRQRIQRFPGAYITAATKETRTIPVELPVSAAPIERADLSLDSAGDHAVYFVHDGGTDLLYAAPDGSEPLAEFVLEGLVGRSVTAGDTVRIPCPTEPNAQKALLEQLAEDRREVACLDATEPTATLDSLLYELFGLDESAQQTVERFLEEFSG